MLLTMEYHFDVGLVGSTCTKYINLNTILVLNDPFNDSRFKRRSEFEAPIVEKMAGLYEEEFFIWCILKFISEKMVMDCVMVWTSHSKWSDPIL